MKPASSIGWRATAAALIALGLAHGAAAETITVTHWGAAFYGAPYAVAMQKGFFKQRGVDITGVLTSTGGGTSVRNTLAGDLPYGEVALPAAVEAIRAGQPLKIVCAGAESIADILILMAMKAQGIDAGKVTLVSAGGIGANLTAVLSGAIDAGMTGEPVWSQERSKVKPVFWTKDVLPPDMTQSVGIVTDELAKAGPEKIRAIIEGRREGVKYIEAHPAEAADIVAQTYNIDPALTREVFRHFLDIKYWSEGALNYAAMDRMVEGLKIVGKLKEPIDWQKVTDVSFLPQDLQARTH